MTIKVATQGEASALVADYQQGSSGAPEPQQMSDLLEEICSASATAEQICTYVKTSGTPITIAAISGGSTDTIFDPEKRVIFFRVDQDIKFAPSRENVITVNRGLILIHELGHAKQFLENSPFYKEMQDWSNGRRIVGPKKTKWSPDYQRAQKSRYGEVGFFAMIEYDNLSRHEWPVCAELNLPKRASYADFCGTAAQAKGKQVQLYWKTTVRKVIEQEKLAKKP